VIFRTPVLQTTGNNGYKGRMRVILFVACCLRLAVVHQRPGVPAPGLFYFVRRIDTAETEKEKELKGEEKAEGEKIKKLRKRRIRLRMNYFQTGSNGSLSERR